VDNTDRWNQQWATDEDVTIDLDKCSLILRELVLYSKNIIANLNIRDGKILDAGGGNGKTLKFYNLSSQNNRLYLVDMSEKAVAFACKQGVEAAVCDLSKDCLPYEDKYFDLVVAQEVIEHLYNYNNIINESYRVLKQGGHLYITTPNIVGLIDRICLLRGKKPLAMTWDKSHIRFFTFGELENEISMSGFKVVVSATQGVYFSIKGRAFRIPLLTSVNKNLGQHIMILAKK